MDLSYSTKPLNVAVIGAGIAGIGTAIRLAAKGHKVDVYEANSYPGGKLSEIQDAGYRFDAGPSLFTLPELVEELFILCKEDPKDHFESIQLTEICNYFYPDQTRLTMHSDTTKLIIELETKLGEKPDTIRKALKRGSSLYESLSELFMFRSLHDLKTFATKAAFKAYLKIPRLGFFSTMNSANESLFENPKTVQLFNRYATYNGSSPYLAPATLNIIPHLEMSMGAYFPKGGMIAITQSLVALAERQGVKFHYQARISQIEIKNKQVTGIRLNDESLRYDRVVSNMDFVNTYKFLLPDVKPPKLLIKQPKSSSALIFYWGIKESFEELDLHNIFFSGDYKKEFECLFESKTVYDDPTVYINISSKFNNTDAPTGCENWFTMINVPNNSGQDWDEIIAESRVHILNKLSKELQRDIQSLIETESILDPRTIESKTSSAQGALYGNSSNTLFAAFLRHANVSSRVKGLYFCGGSVHPGGGIPMSLASAKILSQYFD